MLGTITPINISYYKAKSQPKSKRESVSNLICNKERRLIMERTTSFWYKIAAFLLVVALIVPVLAACGDDNEEKTPTPSATTPAATTPVKTTPAATTPAATTPAATTPTATTPTATVSKEPIKIGVLCSWSGPAAMAGTLADAAIKLVDKELEKKGGINVGGVIRPIKWIRYDDKTQVAENQAGFKKLVLEDKVSAVIYGGATASVLTSESDSAEELKVPTFTVGSTPVDLSNRPYTIRCVYPNATDIGETVMDFVLNNLKPKTVGILFADMKETRERGSQIKGIATAAGVKVVYEQYVPLGTLDFSSFVTRFRMENPEVLLIDAGGPEAYYAGIFKAVPGLGGWGNIQAVCCGSASVGKLALSEKGAEGTYNWTLWTTGLQDEGSRSFERLYLEANGKAAMPIDEVMIYPPMVAIRAIEMAGSDKPADIAKAARSGNLVWENAPGGPFKINADGVHNHNGYIMQFKDGKLSKPTLK